MARPLVELRALKGFTQAQHYVRRGGLFRRSRTVANELIKGGLAEEVMTPLQAMVHGAKTYGVGLFIVDGTKHAASILKECAHQKVGVADKRTPKKGEKAAEGGEQGGGEGSDTSTKE